MGKLSLSKYTFKNTVLIISLVVFTLFNSCKPVIKKSISGKWVVETIAYNNVLINECLLLNLMTFDRNKTCELPIVAFCPEYDIVTSNGNWILQETDSIPLMLTIDTDNRIFSGNHRLIFYRDEKANLFRMEVISDSLYMLCNKNLYNNGLSQDIMNYLVKVSHRDEETWPKNRQ